MNRPLCTVCGLAAAHNQQGGPCLACYREGCSQMVDAAPYRAMVRRMLRYSDNVAAETLARQVGLATDRGGSFADAEAAVRAMLKSLDLWTSGMVIDDNSGLSRENRVSPAALAKAMKLFAVQNDMKEIAVIEASLRAFLGKAEE